MRLAALTLLLAALLAAPAWAQAPEPSVVAFARQVVILKDGRLLDRFDTYGVDAVTLADRYQHECDDTHRGESDGDGAEV